MTALEVRRRIMLASWKPVALFTKEGLIQIHAINAHNMYNAATRSLSNGTTFRFITMGVKSGGGYYPALGTQRAETMFDIYPYPIPNGAKTITILCGNNFAPLIVYYDKNEKATASSDTIIRDCACVKDGETPAAGTDWSISAWAYGDKTYTIPTGFDIDSFTVGFQSKDTTVYNNFDVNNPGITIAFGY